LRNERYVGIMEILSALDLQGSKIVEYPAVLEVRLLGSSKMKIMKTIWGHLQLIGYLAGERLSAGLSSQPAAPGQAAPVGAVRARGLAGRGIRPDTYVVCPFGYERERWQ
jgi:hypothetical protein